MAFLIFYCFRLVVSGQVLNDNIENRFELVLDSVVRSGTQNCTVQPACIDESLTGKCVQYHNDQWFYFRTHDSSELYLNLWDQQCKSLQGVQLIVIDGIPCQPASYTVLNCTSLQTQDDIYIKLSKLNPNQTYLLNIDGYLNDQCTFAIQLSATPKGIPIVQPLNNLQTSRKVNKSTLTISWKVTDRHLLDSLRNFIVMRRQTTEPKAQTIGTHVLSGNAYGFTDSYHVTDSAGPGVYVYRIYGVKHNSEKVLLSEFREEITIYANK